MSVSSDPTQSRTRKAPAVAQDKAVSHNLLGQRLGKKGRDTRERIMAATERLLGDPSAIPLSLSAVAREASLAMTTLYLYFADLTELLLAVLEPIMASAEDAYASHARAYWPDAELEEHCLRFVTDFHGFWHQHARILHLRNYAAGNDRRMLVHRTEASRPLTDMFMVQMDGTVEEMGTFRRGMASTLVTGIERVVTVMTDAEISSVIIEGEVRVPNITNQLSAQAKLLEYGIRTCRDQH